VFTAPESCRSRVFDAAERCGVPVTRIGKINGGCRLKVLDADGRELELHSLGFDHFG
jgi:thiamine-phosphate kinase